MDALVLELAVQMLTGLSVALLAWGGWLCLGNRSPETSDRGARGV